MKLQIAKLRLIGIVALSVALFLYVIEKKDWAALPFFIASISFTVVIILHIYVSFKSGFLKDFITYKEEDEEETL